MRHTRNKENVKCLVRGCNGILQYYFRNLLHCGNCGKDHYKDLKDGSIKLYDHLKLQEQQNGTRQSKMVQ